MVLVLQDGGTVYAEWTNLNSVSGATPQPFAMSAEKNAAWNNVLQVDAGTTKVVKLTGDTTGCATNQTLQLMLTGDNFNAAAGQTEQGIEYQDSSAVNVNLDSQAAPSLPVMPNLPVLGGSLTF